MSFLGRFAIGSSLRLHFFNAACDRAAATCSLLVKNLNFELKMHLVVFVSVSRRDHVTACDELGEYWLTLTRGWGDYDNGNRYAHSHKNKWGVAVGYLYRDDDKLSGRRKFGVH